MSRAKKGVASHELLGAVDAHIEQEKRSEAQAQARKRRRKKIGWLAKCSFGVTALSILSIVVTLLLHAPETGVKAMLGAVPLLMGLGLAFDVMVNQATRPSAPASSVVVLE